MSLRDHARAARILSVAMMDRANAAVDKAASSNDDGQKIMFGTAAATLSFLAMAHSNAAEQMDAEARADIAAIGGGCTLDHATLKGPHCPACRSPIAKR